MGVIYSIACKDCKVTRYLDKFSRHRTVVDREDAKKFKEEMVSEGDKGFRHALLVSFMSEHRGHNCVFFSEHDNIDINGYKEDTNFWGFSR